MSWEKEGNVERLTSNVERQTEEPAGGLNFCGIKFQVRRLPAGMQALLINQRSDGGVQILIMHEGGAMVLREFDPNSLGAHVAKLFLALK